MRIVVRNGNRWSGDLGRLNACYFVLRGSDRRKEKAVDWTVMLSQP